MNDRLTLACSKHPPNFRTISILLPETQGPQSCPLRVNSTDPHSSVLKSTYKTVTISPGVGFRHNCMVSLQKYIKLGSRGKLGDGKCTQIIVLAIRKRFAGGQSNPKS